MTMSKPLLGFFLRSSAFLRASASCFSPRSRMAYQARLLKGSVVFGVVFGTQARRVNACDGRYPASRLEPGLAQEAFDLASMVQDVDDGVLEHLFQVEDGAQSGLDPGRFDHLVRHPAYPYPERTT